MSYKEFTYIENNFPIETYAVHFNQHVYYSLHGTAMSAMLRKFFDNISIIVVCLLLFYYVEVGLKIFLKYFFRDCFISKAIWFLLHRFVLFNSFLYNASFDVSYFFIIRSVFVFFLPYIVDVNGSILHEFDINIGLR